MPVASSTSPARVAATATAANSSSTGAAGASPGMAAFMVLAGIALLGNGLKAIVSSSVLVSEAQFAAFLGISPERVAVLLELIIAGMVVALAACPLLLQRASARTVAAVACAVASASFAAFALTVLSGADPSMRELAAFFCFAFGAGALALLAPTAQALVALTPTRATRTTLTALWTGAAPAGFLIAPQLVKYLLPMLGLGWYFLAFSSLPLVLLALLLALVLVLPAVRTAGTTVTILPPRMLLAFVAAVIAFEVWTTFGSVSGYRTTGAIAGLVALVATALWLARGVRSYTFPPALGGPSGWLLLGLFVIEMPTTGFFDTAFLAQHQHTQAFIADRSTLAAAAQILGTLAAGALVHRRPAAMPALLLGFAAMAATGLAAIAAYPWIDAPTYFLLTPAVEGFGAAGVTLLVCLAVVREAGRHPLLAALPSIAIMLGTEFGLEILQLAFAVARSAGASDDSAYGALFITQLALALVAMGLLGVAVRRQTRGA